MPTEKQLANLRPIPLNKRSKEDRKRIQELGTRAAQAKRAERKTVRAIALEYLQKNHKIKIRGKTVEVTPEEMLEYCITGNLRAIGTGASVRMFELLDEAGGGDKAGTKKDSDLLSGLLGAGNNAEEKDGQE